MVVAPQPMPCRMSYAGSSRTRTSSVACTASATVANVALVLVAGGDPHRPQRVEQVVDLGERRVEVLVQDGAVLR